MILVGAYLVAIVVANLLAAALGPAVTVPNAFFLIGLTITTRDVLHERWEGAGLKIRMAVLIAVGGLLSWAVNADAGPIAVASFVAFTVSETADALVYAILERPWSERVLASNVVAAALDSLIFPTLAFGAVLPAIVAGQFFAKVLGGIFWLVILGRWRAAVARRGAADNA